MIRDVFRGFSEIHILDHASLEPVHEVLEGHGPHSIHPLEDDHAT